VFITIII